jgi:hypothetical protein
MAIDELCIALQMEDCKMEVDKEENSKAVDKPKTTTLGKSVIIPNILKETTEVRGDFNIHGTKYF